MPDCHTTHWLDGCECQKERIRLLEALYTAAQKMLDAHHLTLMERALPISERRRNTWDEFKARDAFQCAVAAVRAHGEDGQ